MENKRDLRVSTSSFGLMKRRSSRSDLEVLALDRHNKSGAARGFSTIEILIAMAIGIIVIAAVLLVSSGNQSAVISSATNAEAVSIAQHVIENEQALGRQDFNLVTSTTSTETIGGITYTKMTTVTLLADFLTKKVVTVIFWVGEKGQSLSTTLTTLITNLDNVNSPNGCSFSIEDENGWQSPDSTNLDIGVSLSDTSSGFPVQNIQAFDKKLYVAIHVNHGNNAATLVIFDTSVDPKDPTPITSTTTSDGWRNLAVASSSNRIYVFGASDETSHQLQVIDATNALSLVFKKNFTAQGSTGGGNAIYYYNNKIYLGLTTGGGPEFHIIDVSNPAAPVWKGSLTIGEDVNAILVKGDYAYVAHAASPSDPNPEQVTVIDVSDPTSPIRKSGWHAPDNVGDGKSLYMLGSTLYLGRLDSANSNPEFYILDDSNPLNLSGNNLNPKGKNIGDDVNGLFVFSHLAFLITANQFQVWDISDTSNITLWGSKDLSGGSNTTANCEGNDVFVGSIPSNDKGTISTVYPVPFDYSLSNGGGISINPGASGNTTITKTSVTGSRSVTLSASGLPVGATATFTNNPCSPTCTSTLTISAASTVAPGTYTISINGSPSGLSSPTTSFTLTIKSFDYSLSNSGNITVAPGAQATTTVTRTFVSGITTPVTLSVSGLPAGANVSYTTNPCSPTCSSNVGIKTSASTPPGTYPITVTGSPNGGSNPSTTFNLVVQGFDYSITNSGNITVTQGNSGSNSITRTYISGTAQPVTLSITGLPAGATASVTSDPCTPTCARTLTITTSASTPVGTYPIIVTGSPNGQSNPSTTFNLVVNTPFDYSLTNNAPGGIISIARKSSGSVIITNTLIQGATTAVTLSTSGIPNQVNTSWSPASGSCSPTCQITLTISPKQASTPGTYTITVNGTPNGTGPRSTSFTLIITP